MYWGCEHALFCKHRFHDNKELKKDILKWAVTGAIIDGNVLKVKNKHRNKISCLLHEYNSMVKRYKVDAKELLLYFQQLQGHLFSAGQINPRYRQLGKLIVARRNALGVKALNQNTK